MSKRLIQDLHAGISRRDWSAIETAANRLRDEVEKTVTILAGTAIGSLPNDYPLAKLASEALHPETASVREGWQCAARNQSLPEPADCNWPMCGCDHHANKVMEALEESGCLSPFPSIPEEKGGTAPLEHVHGPYTSPEELANALDIPVEALTKPTEEKGGTAESVVLLIAKNALANEARRVGPLTIEDMSEVFSRLERTIFASPTEGQTVKGGSTDE